MSNLFTSRVLVRSFAAAGVLLVLCGVVMWVLPGPGLPLLLSDVVWLMAGLFVPPRPARRTRPTWHWIGLLFFSLTLLPAGPALVGGRIPHRLRHRLRSPWSPRPPQVSWP